MKSRKARRLLGLSVCCFLVAALLVPGALARSPGQYQVAGGTISGGDYRLTTADSQASGMALGGGYRLRGPLAPAAGGSGCCCTFLPSVMRQ